MRTVLKYLFFVAFLFGTQTAYSQRKVIANKKVGFQFVKNSQDFYGFDAPSSKAWSNQYDTLLNDRTLHCKIVDVNTKYGHISVLHI